MSELVCALTLVYFLALLAVPLILVKPSTFVYKEMRRLYAVLRYAQRKACVEQRSSTLTFFVERNSYSFDGEYTMHPQVTFGAALGISGPPSAPFSLLTQAVTWPGESVCFTPTEQGSSTTAGSVYLTDRTKSCTYAITCDASKSSRLRCYRYTTKWELLPL